MACFYCTQSDILLCGIARFSRGNKNKLRTFQPQKGKKIKNNQPQTKFNGSCKKKECSHLPETATRGVLCKMVFLETSQNSQENTCARVSLFNKVVGLRPATLLKKRF